LQVAAQLAQGVLQATPRRWNSTLIPASATLAIANHVIGLGCSANSDISIEIDADATQIRTTRR
jgi:hypothetical protein